MYAPGASQRTRAKSQFCLNSFYTLVGHDDDERSPDPDEGVDDQTRALLMSAPRNRVEKTLSKRIPVGRARRLPVAKLVGGAGSSVSRGR
jgi:hypothetical protein